MRDLQTGVGLRIPRPRKSFDGRQFEKQVVASTNGIQESKQLGLTGDVRYVKIIEKMKMFLMCATTLLKSARTWEERSNLIVAEVG